MAAQLNLERFLSKAFSSEVGTGSREENASKKAQNLNLFGLVPFRLEPAGGRGQAALASEYQERYGLDIPEWRVLATLGFRDDALQRAIYLALHKDP